jgi:hypothetical protein
MQIKKKINISHSTAAFIGKEDENITRDEEPRQIIFHLILPDAFPKSGETAS